MKFHHLIYSEKQIANVTKRIGSQLSKVLKKENNIPVVIGIMKGSMNFMMDIIKNIDTEIFLDYIQVSSYAGNSTTGKVILKRHPSFDLKNRTVVVVEDIIDTGISMDYLIDYLNEHHHPKKIILVALVDKRPRRKCKIEVDYSGFILKEDDFLIGYGLDYNEIGRNLPCIYGLDSQEIKMLDKKIKCKNRIYYSD